VDFLEIFSVKPPISNLTQICPVEAALVYAGRWTDGQTYRQMDGRTRCSCIYMTAPEN